MPGPLEDSLSRWQDAGIIDDATATRIRAFENASPPNSRLRLPVILALVFGAILLGAGVLLFVAAHWDDLSPTSRFAVVVTMVAAFHVGAAFAAPPFPDMATTLHAIGTIALGAGIYLCGQIFNLNESWPSGMMLWALGAWIAWYLRRDWVQLLLAALLTPAAVSAEWSVRHGFIPNADHGHKLLLGLTLLAVTYATVPTPQLTSLSRTVLSIVGYIALIPLVIASGVVHGVWTYGFGSVLSALLLFLVTPLALAWWLRRFEAWKNLCAAVWLFVLGLLADGQFNIATEAWCALGAIGLVAWGMHESRAALINLGTIGFAFSVMFFYFTDVMDKLDRSLSLILLGVLFLAGGWALEKLRRRLIAGLNGVTA
jgi:uncharacterized membrane protein